MSTNNTILPNNHNIRISSPHHTAAAMNQHNNPKTTQDTATIIQNQINQLKKQAENLETTARKLREIANILELQRQAFINHSQQASSSSSNSITNTHTNTEEAPLDEHGNPKYKGKKRGRKPKKRKRCLAKKRGHTAYTLVSTTSYYLIEYLIISKLIMFIFVVCTRRISESQGGIHFTT